MNKKEAIEKLDELKKTEAELRKIIEAPEGRKRVGLRENYWLISPVGKIKRNTEDFVGTDDDYFNSGNYFLTEEDAKNSQLYHTLNSDYFYWHPGCPKLKEMPDNLQVYESCMCKWVNTSLSISRWMSSTYRWPK